MPLSLDVGGLREIVVVEELVTAPDQQVRRGALHAAADHALLVLLELRRQRREITVAREQRERVDVRLLVTEVQRVDDHADVGAVLAARLRLRDVHQLHALRVEIAQGVPVPAPVAVGALVDDPPLLEQAPQHEIDLEVALAHAAHADREVLVVHEDGDQRFFGHGRGGEESCSPASSMGAKP